jgi:hypothetical protein
MAFPKCNCGCREFEVKGRVNCVINEEEIRDFKTNTDAVQVVCTQCKTEIVDRGAKDDIMGKLKGS